MKQALLAAVLLLFILAVSGCSFLDNTPLQSLGNRIDSFTANPFNNTAKEHPEERLKLFLVSLQNQDFAAATQYVSHQARQSLTEKFLEGMAIGEGFNLSKVRFDKDQKSQKPNLIKAYIYYKYNKEPEGSLGQEAIMVKENGNWQVLSFGEFNDY